MRVEHIAFSIGSEDAIITLTERLRSDGYRVVSKPRSTGNRCFESCIYDSGETELK